MNTLEKKIEKIIRYYNCRDYDGYNIFRILRLTKQEVTTQSVIIADLLNPESIYHNQGKEFLKLFLKYTNLEDFELIDYKVKVEFHTKEFGRIDILLEEKDKSKAILIENKVYAQNQPLQLERYRKFCIDKYKDAKSFKILYLTQFGTAYQTQDVDLKAEVINISYNKQIIDWILECCKISNDPNQVTILNQFVSALDYLTNIDRRRIRNRLIQFEIYKNKQEAIEIKEFLNNHISKHRKLYDTCESDLNKLIAQYNISQDKKFSLENLTHEEFYKILGIKKKLTFFDIVKIEN